MARLLINIGAAPNDLTGDPLRVAFDKINKNFEEIYGDEEGELLTADEVAAIKGSSLPSALNPLVTQSDINSFLVQSDISDFVTMTDITALDYATQTDLNLAIADFLTFGDLDGTRGNITVSGAGTSWVINNDAVSFAQMQNIASGNLLGNFSGVAGDVALVTPETLTANMPIFTSLSRGMVPNSDGGTTTFLRADGSWTSALVADGDKGDITVSATGSVWTIDASAVSTTKIADSAVTDAKIADVAWGKISGVPTFAGLAAGLVPTSDGGTVNFLREDGTWAAPAGGGSMSIGTIDSQTKSADGGAVSGSTLYFQTADETNPGLLSTGAQIIEGAKTFNQTVTLFADLVMDALSQNDALTQILVRDTLDNTIAWREATFWSTTGTTDLDTAGVFINSYDAVSSHQPNTSATYAPTVRREQYSDFNGVSNLWQITATGLAMYYSDSLVEHRIDIDVDGTTITGPAFLPSITEDATKTRSLVVDDLTGKVFWKTIGGITDGDKGDITVSTSGTVWTIDDSAITNGKLASNAVTTVKINNGAVTNSKITNCDWSKLLNVPVFAGGAPGVVPTSTGGTTNFLRADGTWAAPSTSGTIADGDKGDITVSGSGTVWTIDNDSVSFAKLSNVVTNVFVGRYTAGDGDLQVMTPAQATSMLSLVTDVNRGLAPASGGGTTNYLRADGTWAAPPGLGLADGDKGDITVSSGGTVWTIDNDSVSFAKLSNVVTNVFMGRYSAGTGDIQVMTPAQATSMLDLFTSTNRGAAPASGGGTTNFLRADGVWAAPAGGGSPGGTTNELQKNNGGAFDGTGVYSSTDGSLVLGSASMAGDRIISASGSAGSVNISIMPQGSAGVVSLGQNYGDWKFSYDGVKATCESTREMVFMPAAGTAIYFGGTNNINYGFGLYDLSTFDGMEGGIYMQNAVAIPTGGPATGAYLYVQNGAIYARGQSGTLTQIAPA